MHYCRLVLNSFKLVNIVFYCFSQYIFVFTTYSCVLCCVLVDSLSIFMHVLETSCPVQWNVRSQAVGRASRPRRRRTLLTASNSTISKSILLLLLASKRPRNWIGRESPEVPHRKSMKLGRSITNCGKGPQI